MPRGKPATKLAITMDADVHARVLRAAEAEGSNLSAWLTAAAKQVLRVRDGLAAVAEWEAEHGPLTDAELGAARQRLDARTRVESSLKPPVKPARADERPARKVRRKAS
jgi:hypothetical protein